MSEQQYDYVLASSMADWRKAVKEAQEKGLCIVCQLPAEPKIYSTAGKAEYQISACCERCFDEMYAEKDDDLDRDQDGF